jgi:hypothetical protein
MGCRRTDARPHPCLCGNGRPLLKTRQNRCPTHARGALDIMPNTEPTPPKPPPQYPLLKYEQAPASQDGPMKTGKTLYGRTSGRDFGRLKSARGRNSTTSAAKGGNQLLPPFAKCPPGPYQASQQCSQRQSIPLFEPVMPDGTRIVTDNNSSTRYLSSLVTLTPYPKR